MPVTIKDDLALSILSYQDNAELESNALWQEMKTDGWVHLGHSDSFYLDPEKIPNNGFEAQVFQSPKGEVVIAYTGTQPSDVRDIVTDIQLALHGDPKQRDSAIELANLVIVETGVSELHVTGHSLGGYLAQEVTFALNQLDDIQIQVKGSGFNSPGMGDADETDPNFFNLQGDSDLIHLAGGDHFGGSTTIDSSISVLSVLKAHGSKELYEEISQNYPELAVLSAKEFASWDTDKKESFIEFVETGVEDIDNPYDWENDGVGAWTGSLHDFATADFDSIMDGMDLDGLDWGDQSTSTGGSVETVAPELQSVYGFYQALQGSNDYAKLTAGLNMIGQLDGDSTALDHFMAENASFNAAQSVFAVYTFYNALESDDGLVAASSGLRMLDSMGVNIPGMPYLSLATAVISGDPNSIVAAGLTMIPVYGWVAAAVFSAVVKPPPAHAWSEFTINEDGSISVDVDSNDTGEGLENSLSGYADALVEVLHNTQDILHSNNLDFQQSYIPRFGMLESDVYLEQSSTNEEGRITVRNHIDGDTVLSAMRDSVVFESMVANGLTSFNPSPYLGDTDWSHSVRGTGVFAGGGNVGGNRSTVYAKDSDIKLLAPKPQLTIVKELAEVMKTWRLDQNLFAGEGGKLLALGLGAGIVDFDAVMAAKVLEQEVQSITGSEAYASLLAGIEGDVIIAGRGEHSGVLDLDDQTPSDTKEFAPSPMQDFASSYVAEVDDADIGLGTDNKPSNPISIDGSPGVVEFDEDAIWGLSNERLANDSSEEDAETTEVAVIEVGDSNSDEGFSGGRTTGDVVTDNTAEFAPVTPDLLRSGSADRLHTIEDRDLYTRVETLLANDQQGAEFVGLGEVKYGTVSLNADGEIYFVPEADYAGDAAGFAYLIKDSEGKEETIWVTVDVANVNDRPDAVDDSITVLEDTVVNLSAVLDNDLDVDGEALHIVTFSQPQHGEISINSAGGYLFTPEPDYVGSVELMYVVEDQSGARSIARSHITFTEGLNDAPRVINEYFSDGIEETAYRLNADSLLANDVDPEGASVHLGAIRMQNGGEAAYNTNTGEIIVTPDENFNGEGVLEYEVVDGGGNTRVASATIYFENTADAFSTGDQTIQIAEDTVTIFTPEYLTAMADNADGQTMVTAARMADASEGRVVMLPDGNVQFFPAADFVGETAIEVRLSNGTERIVSRIDISVNAVNDAPHPEDDIFLGAEDTSHTLNITDLLANDSDAEGDAFELIGVELSDSESGALSFDQARGEIVFTPTVDFNGDAVLNYTVREKQSGLESSAQATIVLEAQDDTAETTDKVFTIDEDMVREFSLEELLDVLQDVDGEALSLTGFRLTDPVTGSLQSTAEGGLEFTPAADYSGEAEFTIDVSDGVTSETVTMTVNIAALNDAPKLVEDRFGAGVEDAAYSFNISELTANDSDVEGDVFEVSAIELRDLAQGTINWNQATGEVTLIPADDFNGEVALSYTVSETQSGAENTANATVVFAPQNDTANITDKVFSLAEDETRLFTKEVLLDVLVDVDGDVLLIQSPILSDAAAGTIEVTAQGNVLFTPASEYSGEVSFDIQILDSGDGSTTSATMSLSIAQENDAPSGASPRFDAVEDTAYTLTTAALLAGVADAEGHVVELTAVRVADPVTGSVSWDQQNNKIVFTPAQDYFGEARLEYVLRDELGAQSTNTATLIFAGTDDTAELSGKAFTIAEDETTIFRPEALLGVLIDVDGEALMIHSASLSDETAGVMSVIDGNVQFIPATEFAGELSFDIEVSDGVTTQTVTMALNVETVNDAPAVVDDEFIDGVEDQSYRLNVAELLANDSDAEGDEFSVVAVEVIDPSQGVVGWDQASGEIEFTPAENFNGEARLSYTVQETQSGIENTASAGIIFAPVNDTVQIVDKGFKDQRFNLFEDESKIFTRAALLDVAKDVDGEPLSIVNVSLDPAHGSVEITPDGNIRFVPAQDYVGEANFEIEVDDGTGITAHAQMTVKLWPVNDEPVAVDDDGFSMGEDSTLTINGADILANDSDAETGPLKIAGVWASSSGSAVYDAEADQINFTPNNDIFGTAWVDYIVEDQLGGWDVARINVHIANVDDPVEAIADTVFIDEDTPTVWPAETFTGNDHNPDLENLTITAIDASSIMHGTVQLKPDGTIEYMPEAEYSGVQTFSYTVADESGHSSQAEVTLDVQEVNDAPVVALHTDQVLEDERISFTFDELMLNASDVEDDWMRIVGIRSDYGDVRYNEAAETLSFLPMENLNSHLYGGPIAVEYLVVDERGGETWASIAVDVVPVNDPPVAINDVLLAWESGPGNYTNPVLGDWLTANDIEVDGEAIWVDSIMQGTSSNVSLDKSTQQMGYQAQAGFVGEDTFTYRVVDGVEDSNDWGQVTVHVMDNHAPIASDFGTIAAEDTILRFEWDDIAQYVYDEDLNFAELPEDIKVISVTGATNGEVSLNVDGSISFDPTDNYNSEQHGGVATFDFTVEDIVGNQSMATASIIYTPVNDNPVGRSEVIGGAREDDTDFIFTAEQLLGGDTDVDEDTLFITGVWGAAHGSINLDGNGEVHYTPNSNYNGRETFTYRVADGNGGYDDIRSYIDVAAVNDIPVVQFDSAMGDDDKRNYYSTSSLLGNDYDVDGDKLTISNVRGGSLSGGGIAYTGPEGHHTIYYTVNDGHGGSAESRLYLDIQHTNQPPTFTGGGAGLGWESGRQKFWANAWDQEDQDHGRNYNLSISAPGGINVDANGHNEGGKGYSWDIRAEDSNYARGSYYVTNVTFTVGVSDSEGAQNSARKTVQVRVKGTLFEGGEGPVVIDMNGDGLNLMGYNESGALFDWQADGDLDRTGWISSGDGLLAYDHDGNGMIDQQSEISFTEYLEGAQTDLEGLAGFDTNNNGLFDSADAHWGEFGVWMDDGDGTSQTGEFVSLDEVGLQSINLRSDGLEYDINGNHVYGTTEVMFIDGAIRDAGDVMFTYAINEDENRETQSDKPGELAMQSNSGFDKLPREVAPDEQNPGDSGMPGLVDAGAQDSELTTTEINTVMGNDVADLTSATSTEEHWLNQDDRVSETIVALDVSLADAPILMNDLGLPSDSELDRMVLSAVEKIASQPPVEDVPLLEHAETVAEHKIVDTQDQEDDLFFLG